MKGLKEENGELVIPLRKNSYFVIAIAAIILMIVSAPLMVLIGAVAFSGDVGFFGAILTVLVALFLLWLWKYIIIDAIKLRSSKAPGLVINIDGYVNYTVKKPKKVLWEDIKYFDDDLLFELGYIKVLKLNKSEKQLEVIDKIKCNKLKVGFKELFNVLKEKQKIYQQ